MLTHRLVRRRASTADVGMQCGLHWLDSGGLCACDDSRIASPFGAQLTRPRLALVFVNCKGNAKKIARPEGVGH